jgi:hypothetical protein
MNTRTLLAGSLAAAALLGGTLSVVAMITPSATLQPPHRAQSPAPGALAFDNYDNAEKLTSLLASDSYDNGEKLTSLNVSRYIAMSGLSNRRLVAAGIDPKELPALQASLAANDSVVRRAAEVLNAESDLRKVLSLERSDRINTPDWSDSDAELGSPSAAVREKDSSLRKAHLQMKKTVLLALPPQTASGLAAVDIAEFYSLPLELAPSINSHAQARQLRITLNSERRQTAAKSSTIKAGGFPADWNGARAKTVVASAQSHLAALQVSSGDDSSMDSPEGKPSTDDDETTR